MYSTLLHIYICSVMYPSADIYFWFEFINVVLRIVILAKFNMICFNRNASVIMATNQFLLLLFRLLFSQQSRITSNGTSRKCSIVLTGRNTSYSMISVGYHSIYIVEYLNDDESIILLTSSSTSLRFVISSHLFNLTTTANCNDINSFIIILVKITLFIVFPCVVVIIIYNGG